MKLILCVKVTPENKDFLRQLAAEKSRSVSNIVDRTISDLKQVYERRKNDGNFT